MTTKQHVIDIAERAVVTFVEVFVPFWAATNYSFSKVALWSAFGSALSVVWNTAVKMETSRQVNAALPPVAPVPQPPVTVSPAAPVQ